MIAMTTSSSINVNAVRFDIVPFSLGWWIVRRN
jgi:hypothetical protein